MLLSCLKYTAGRALFSLSLVLSTVISSVAPAMAGTQGWVLTQRSDKIGDQYVYVAPNGVKLVNPKIGYNIILCAPDWNVCIFNDKTRAYYSASYSAWMQEVARSMHGANNELRSGQWTKSQPSTICGLKATAYKMQGAGSHHMRNATCWVSDDIVVPPQITRLLAQSYGLPDNKAYPLKLDMVTTSGKLNVILDTYNSQPCDIPDAYFYLPNGYTRVASKEEVMMDDDTKAILRDLANDSPSGGGGSGAASVPQRQQTYQQPTYRQPTYQQQTTSQYSQPTQQAQQSQAQPAQPVATPGVITLPNGQTLDKEKMRRIIEAIKNSGNPQAQQQQQQQTPTPPSQPTQPTAP